ncbi:nucleoporin [Ophiostoma piceae UAMH 11346]|uniref:Nucleoporin n=1 Tax=Ophiostoma piceae (strain UAMH 11346) TaxID=1262450 RepID=S3BZQ1_OPHP1|nr:nucleoporin [Ophiostoma piceae UAMH 11346]
MSFGSGGFGFGQNNQQSTGFGGFGANNNTTAGGFGSTGTGAFGAKPAFGAATTTAGGLFGSTTATAGSTGFGTGGGFGSPMTAGTTAGGFGSGTNTMFGGASKPAFGASPSTGGLFGSAAASTTPGFGGGASTGFGATAAPANTGDPPGTNTVPFQAFIEKEATSNQHNSFQNILFMDAYKKWSPEELRLTDYNQGRRFGNATGTGAFGVGSNFGGFGASSTPAASTTGGGGLFGAGNNTASTGFGAQPSASTGGFGASTAGGGLFGAKPAATGGLFGSTATTAPAATGGLFGSTTGGFGGATTAGGFGSTPAAATGGGLFGNTAAQKPATGFGFGGAATGTTGFGGGAGTTGGFGASTTGTGAAGGGLFGNTAANTGAATGGGLFGGGAQQGTTGATTGFGSGATTGFGAQPQASGGLFGAKPAATGGLFGSAPAATAGTGATGGLFGSSTSTPFGGGAATQQTGGLFGAKPAAPAGGGGLFGNSQPAAGAATGGGLFGGMGQNQAAQPAQQSGGLFGGGGLGQTAQKPSLFGGSTASTGGGMFGGQATTQQQAGGGLFGNSMASAQPQAQGLGGSMFGNSQQGAGMGASQNGLTTSINDTGAYGAPSLFQSLASQEIQNPGPLATPLSVSKNKTSRRSSILPLYKMNPGSASKFATPQKRGYGFSYSTFGTPSSVGSTASTPGTMSQSLMVGSIGRGGLTKSISSSNLRRTFNPEDSVLLPGAFSSNSGPRFYGSSGGSKKLVINRDMRSDLFSTPTKARDSSGADLLADNTAVSSRKLTKRVSFDTTIAKDTVPEQGPNGSSDHDMGYLRPQARSNGSASNGASSSSASNGSSSVVVSPASPGQPEMEQVSTGKELAIVHEEDSPRCIPDNYRVNSKELGDYWMIPSRAEIEQMNRVQRQQVANFTVGRTNVGQVRFRVPVDLTKINLDTILDGIVTLIIRSATVYPDVNTKPPVGNGLNVPAEIMLLHTSPRSGSEGNPAKMKKHVQRLKNIPDTTFVSYDEKTAAWVFRVEHFTTYGLDDDDEDDETDADTTAMSAAPAPFAKSIAVSRDVAIPSIEEQPRPKSFRRKRATVPGAFDNDVMEDDDQEDEYEEDDATPQQSFLSNRSADMSSQALVPIQSMEHDEDDNMELGNESGLYEHEGGEAPYGLQTNFAAELNNHNSLDFSTFAPALPAAVTETPAGIMRARLRAIKESNTPVKLQVPDGDNWMEMLQKTVSPQKRDRAALKALGEYGAPEKAVSFKESTNFSSTFNNKKAASVRGRNPQQNDNRGFATSIDLMNSLFEKAKAPASTAQPTDAIAPAKGFVKWPYKRSNKPTDEDEAPLDPSDKAFHDSAKPIWSTDGSCIVAETQGATNEAEPSLKRIRVFDSIGATLRDDPLDNLSEHKETVDVQVVDGIPVAVTARIPTIKTFAASCEQGNRRRPPAASELAKELGSYEQSVWELASVLFDPTEALTPAEEARQRRENLAKFWAELVQDSPSAKTVDQAQSVEEKAVLQLASRKVPEACRTLVDSKNLKLAALVSLIGSSDSFKKDMREQVNDWHEGDVLAEFSIPLRSIYSMLAGNVAVCEGKKGGGVENRMDTVVLSNWFGLDWKQAFGLRLWYGVSSGDGIESAVAKYVEDLEQGRVPAPRPWYSSSAAADKASKNTASAAWADAQREQREDLLFGLLKVAAGLSRLEDVLEPENSQPSPFRYRFCWQLNQALSASPSSAAAIKLSTEKADSLTSSYASEVVYHTTDDDQQISASGDGAAWVHAIWVLLHLSDRTARTQAIQDVLGRHAGSLFANTSSKPLVNNGERAISLYDTLVDDLKIPAQWIWQAAALYWRNQQDQPVLEAECLLRASAYADAHRIFVKELAPKAIVERNYGEIAEMLEKLQPHRQQIKDWALGGEVYSRFLDLLNYQKGTSASFASAGSPTTSAPRTRSRQQQVRDEVEQASTQLISTVEALASSLPAMYENARSALPTEVAAITEMADVVAKETMVLANKGRMDLTKISRLPLTQDRRVRYSTDLAFAYYREVMSA